MASTSTKKNSTPGLVCQASTDVLIKQGVSWGVDGAVLATSAVKGGESSSPTPQGASSFVQGAGSSRSSPGAAAGGGGGTDRGYLESHANVSGELASEMAKQCPGYWLLGSCENGHRFAKELYCGREWCEVCGVEWSAAQQRRFARWLPKAYQIRTMGYFVFTIPEELRAKYRTKEALSRLGHKVQELLKSYGYARGLRRWHWFGEYAGLIRGREVNLDELRVPYLKAFNRLIEAASKMDQASLLLNPNKATIFWSNPGGQQSGVIARLVADFAKAYGLHLKPYSSIELNPHSNCMVDGGYLAPEKLEAIKRAYAGILGCQVVDVNYRYRRSAGEKVHTLKYVTRATFRDFEWDSDMARQIHGSRESPGLRNQVSWGRGLWDQEPVWSLDDLEGAAREDVEELDPLAVESLESGKCPRCGLPITWSKAIGIERLEAVEKRALGAGYWELPWVRPPPEFSKEEKQRLYLLEILHRAERNLSKSLGGHYLPTEFRDKRWAEFLAQHRRFAEYRQLLKHLEDMGYSN